jgi:hypothetical protein
MSAPPTHAEELAAATPLDPIACHAAGTVLSPDGQSVLLQIVGYHIEHGDTPVLVNIYLHKSLADDLGLVITTQEGAP